MKKIKPTLKKYGLDSFEVVITTIAGGAFLVSVANYYIGLIF